METRCQQCAHVSFVGAAPRARSTDGGHSTAVAAYDLAPLSIVPDSLTSSLIGACRSADVTLTILFVLEISLQLLHLGVYNWIRDPWNVIDGVIVLCALLSYAPIGANSLGATSGLRAMRVLKPLRTLRRFPSLKETSQTFIQSIPPTTGVVVMIVFNWIILGILGVQTLGRKLRKCSDATVVTNALCVGENRTLGSFTSGLQP